MRPFRSRPKAGSRGDPSDPLARNQRNDTSRIFSQLVDRSVSASTQATTTLTAPDTKYLPSRPATRHEFEIAIICALTLEADAVAALFDQHWDYNGPPYDKAPGDPNAYTTGAIGRHNVVLVHMPGMGKANAAAGAANCRASFPNIKLAAVVGICGAVPFGPDGSEIVLGDVIISDGVVQYDLGRRHPDRFVRKDTLSDSLGRPTAEIRALLSKLKSRHDRSTLQDKLAMHLKVIQDNPELEAQYPGAANDRLLEATYHHTSEGSLCNESGCSGPLVLRRRLEQENTQPIVHFGLIASGDTVMRSGEERDSIAQRERVLGFEMEGAGVWDSFPCIVIKGVCDYADSHKAKSWQRYAGATAAACLKAFLEFWIPSLSSVQEPYSVAKQPTGMWLPERPETPPQPSFMVPFSHDTNFIERRYLLNRIHQACLEPASRTALVGLGGNGKSQLAIEYTYRVRDAFKKQNKQIWVFWVHAGTRARVEEGFKTIADAIKLPERNQPQADILQLVYQWLRDERNGQWLMVLDSADNIDVFYDTDEKSDQKATEGEKRALWTYLPQSANGSILVTTRNKDLASRLTVSYRDIIEVGPMDQDQAFRLLAMKLGSQYDKDDGKKLVEALEYIPLAISQAAAYIQKRAPRTSVKKYLEEFRESERKQSSLLNYDNGDLRRDRDASNSVINTWQISFDYIRSKRPSATELLSFMSFFDCQGILESLIRPIYRENNTDDEDSVDDEELTDNESISSHEVMNNEFEDDITMLRDYCLVGTNEKGDVFEMHGLVQLSTRKWLDVYGETERFKVQYISRMAQAFPPGDFQNWRTCQKLFPHAERAILHRPVDEKSLEEWALLLFNGSRYCLEQGKYALSKTMARQSYETRKTILGPDHPSTLISMTNLASTYQNQGRWKKAELLKIQVLEASKTVLGPDHPHTLTSINNLASTYWNQGRWKEAESLNVQVLETRKTVLGLDHPDTLISMANLASTYWNQGKRKEAESLEVQVLETSKTVLGPDHPDTLISMSNLAFTWDSQGRKHDAFQLLEQCYHARMRVLGPEHPSTQSSLSTIQDWRIRESQTRKRRRWRRMVKNTRTSTRIKFRKRNSHRESNAS